MKNKKSKIVKVIEKNFLNAIILILFIILAISFSKYHEHWADEAQSWLIARDNSIIEILNYTKYEGTPCLWFLILKVFINIGFTYDYFYLIPIIITSVGLFLLLFKVKLPWYIRILFPFSYFVFFQTTIVCRSYCLVLPLITFIYLFYPTKIERPIRFFVALIFFMNISLHTYLVSGSIFLIYLYDFYKKNKKLEKKVKLKNIISIVITIFSFLLILILLFPKSDIGFGGDGGNSLLYILGEASISSNNIIFEIIALVVFIYILYKYNSIENAIKIVILFLLLVSMLMTLHCQIWHISIVFELIFIILLKDIDKKEIRIFITIMLSIQVIWNIQTLKFDYNNLYSSAREVADFIKEFDYDNKKIYGIKYMPTAVQAYFDKNIFENYNSNKANYCWSTSNGYDTYEEVMQDLPDICIIPITIMQADVGKDNIIQKYIELSDSKDLIYKLENEGYILYNFIGNLYTKNLIEEQENFLVYVKK